MCKEWEKSLQDCWLWNWKQSTSGDQEIWSRLVWACGVIIRVATNLADKFSSTNTNLENLEKLVMEKSGN